MTAMEPILNSGLRCQALKRGPVPAQFGAGRCLAPPRIAPPPGRRGQRRARFGAVP